ncbi:MAG: hypothetical protein K6F35_02760 [Lachnospiraceae bacterium]|nr:hypothetical protein [Lachnospiraceae bacterium]
MDNFMDRLADKINQQNNSRSQSYRERDGFSDGFQDEYRDSYRDDRPGRSSYRDSMTSRDPGRDRDMRGARDSYRDRDRREPYDMDFTRAQERPQLPQRERDMVMEAGAVREDVEKLALAMRQAQTVQTAEFGETRDMIRNSSDRIMGAITNLSDQVAEAKKAPVPGTEAGKQEGEGALNLQAVEEIATSAKEEMGAMVSDVIHKEDVKLYRNVQAVIQDESTKTMERLKILDLLQGLQKLDQMDGSADAVKKRMAGIKGILIANLVLLGLNFCGIILLILKLVAELF